MSTWTDWQGRCWHVTTMRGRLKFNIPCHAALRAHIFHRDGFKCRRCGVQAADVPQHYDGRETLFTDSRDGGGWRVLLILDHILTLKAGGGNTVDNLQALCEQCNKSKQREDKAAAALYRRGLL